MTAGIVLTGAPTHNSVDWASLNWRKLEGNVRRLQARIVQAIQAGRRGKVKALQRLLTRSFSAKAMAVKRVTENKNPLNYCVLYQPNRVFERLKPLTMKVV